MKSVIKHSSEEVLRTFYIEMQLSSLNLLKPFNVYFRNTVYITDFISQTLAIGTFCFEKVILLY